MLTPEDLILRLSLAQRELLIAHIDGPFGIVADNDRSRKTLTRLGLLSLAGCDRERKRPHHSVLTEAGRRAVALILADYADALVRAGYLEPAPDESPLQVLARLKAQNRPVSAPIPPGLAESARKIS